VSVPFQSVVESGQVIPDLRELIKEKIEPTARCAPWVFPRSVGLSPLSTRLVVLLSTLPLRGIRLARVRPCLSPFAVATPTANDSPQTPRFVAHTAPFFIGETHVPERSY
jgi:hypothetical protein